MAASDIKEIRILPPLAIGRFGSSPDPMDNYVVLDAPDAKSPRTLEPATTLIVEDGKIVRGETPVAPVRFTDSNGRVRPVAPFFEVWARFEDGGPLRPLKKEDLVGGGIKWTIEVANLKAFRRTNDLGDAVTDKISIANDDHTVRDLQGTADNFLDDPANPGSKKSIPFGKVVFLEPTDDFPEIRLRVIPGLGQVYGFEEVRTGNPEFVVVDEKRVVYDTSRGVWHEYSDSRPVRPVTNPAGIFRGGLFDDAFDGILEARIEVNGGVSPPSAFARVSVGPPDFAPDSQSVRTVSDELEQIVLGSSFTGQPRRGELIDTMRRAVETVRLMNTAAMNTNGMSGHDARFGRDREPIFNGNPDTPQIAEKHEGKLQELMDQGSPLISLFLRKFDSVGDLSNSQRRRMAALMRGSDGRHLALTRRQLAKLAAAESNGIEDDPPPTPGPVTEIEPTNLMAQIHYAANGNPPVTAPATAIANCFPGLEFDFRNLWRRIFVGIELHESDNLVTRVDNPTDSELGGLRDHILISVRPRGAPRADEFKVEIPATGPGLLDGAVTNLEWTNSLAQIVDLRRAGPLEATCVFRRPRPALISSSGRLQIEGLLGFFGEGGTRDFSSNTFWATPARATMQPEFLVMDLGAQRKLQAVELFPAGNSPQLGVDFFEVFPVSFVFDGSQDGQNWTELMSVSSHVPTRDQWSRFEFAETSVAFLRLRIAETRRVSPTGPFLAAIGEWRFDEVDVEELEKHLPVRDLLESATSAFISRDIANPGELTQGLCSPWQQDYRECACYYWAASRPDYINWEEGTGGQPSRGHNWLDLGRNDPANPKEYILDGSPQSGRLITYFQMYAQWEKHLKFVIDRHEI